MPRCERARVRAPRFIYRMAPYFHRFASAVHNRAPYSKGKHPLLSRNRAWLHMRTEPTADITPNFNPSVSVGSRSQTGVETDMNPIALLLTLLSTAPLYTPADRAAAGGAAAVAGQADGGPGTEGLGWQGRAVVRAGTPAALFWHFLFCRF